MARDPLTFGPKPPFSAQKKSDIPGHEADMDPKPDHGLESHTGRNRLTDRAALITGGDSGIGRAVAILFAKEGADVAFTYLPEEKDDAQATVEAVEAQGRKAYPLEFDLSQPSVAPKVVEQAIAKLRKLDILVNNAAYQRTYAKLADVPGDEFAKAYAVNVGATFAIIQAAEKHLKPGASIINTTSIQAVDPSPNIFVYASTKGAISNLTKGLAKLLGEKGIRVNGVAPGPVWTPLIPGTMDADKLKEFGAKTVFGRPAQPVEEAAAYVFLASDEASFVTGEIIGVTGGMTPV